MVNQPGWPLRNEALDSASIDDEVLHVKARARLVSARTSGSQSGSPERIAQSICPHGRLVHRDLQKLESLVELLGAQLFPVLPLQPGVGTDAFGLSLSASIRTN
jgi:hypothetical protein